MPRKMKEKWRWIGKKKKKEWCSVLSAFDCRSSSSPEREGDSAGQCRWLLRRSASASKAITQMCHCVASLSPRTRQYKWLLGDMKWRWYCCCCCVMWGSSKSAWMCRSGNYATVCWIIADAAAWFSFTASPAFLAHLCTVQQFWNTFGQISRLVCAVDLL